MQVLVVGAGTVGQVFAWHLAQAGAKVTFFVKPKYVEEVKKGLTLYSLNHSKNKSNSIFFNSFQVMSSFEEVQKEKWDQVYLTFSTAALDEKWIESLSTAIGAATVVSIQPGMHSVDELSKSISRKQIVRGVVSWISYFTPMQGETVAKPGVAFWFPLNSKSPFSGEDLRVKEVVEALTRGGLPSKIDMNVESGLMLPSLFLQAGITGLELVDWKFDRAKNSVDFKLACEAARESGAIEGAGQSVCVIQPWVAYGVMKLAQKIMPFDFETYMKEHFTKVGDQTLVHMKNAIELGQKNGLKTSALEQLNEKLKAKRAETQSIKV